MSTVRFSHEEIVREGKLESTTKWGLPLGVKERIKDPSAVVSPVIRAS